MDLPDKDEQPLRYTKIMLKEMRKSTSISGYDKALLNDLGKHVFLIHTNINGSSSNLLKRPCYLEESHMYVLDAFDMVYNLVLKSKDKDKSETIKKMLCYSEEIFQKIGELKISLESLFKETADLEAKIVSEEIVEEMKRSNHNP